MEPIMIAIPAGELTMGFPKPPAAFASSRLWHSGKSLPVKSFCMSSTTITNAQYQAFVDDTNAPANPWMIESGFNAEDQPVVNINWHDAKAYCDWLSQKTGRPYRLPTDAEWEYAARGGSPDTIFPWGDDCTDSQTWFGGKQSPKPVASYAPNGYGLYDMIGNVWEWCEDRFEDVSEGVAATNIVEPTDQPRDNRVLRGGSYLTTDIYNLYIAYRHEDPPSLRHQCLGFRVASDH